MLSRVQPWVDLTRRKMFRPARPRTVGCDHMFGLDRGLPDFRRMAQDSFRELPRGHLHQPAPDHGFIFRRNP